MSEIFSKFNIFNEISEQLKQEIKLFHIFDDSKGKNVFFITNEDKVFAMGSNIEGKCGFGHKNRVNIPQLVPELCGQQIKQFFIGRESVLAFNRTNQVFGWGRNNCGQLGRKLNYKLNYMKPAISPSLKNMVEISCSYYHSLGLDSNQNVFGWGRNIEGQIGCGKGKDCFDIPVQLKSLAKIKSIFCHYNKSFAITIDGLVYSWGENQKFCLGHQLPDDIHEPKLITGLNNIISIGCSFETEYDRADTYFLTADGKLYYCGFIDENSCEYQKTPKLLDTDLKFQTLQSYNYFRWSACHSRTLAVSDETVYQMEFSKVIKTGYKTTSDYCFNEQKITFKTYLIKYFNDMFDELCEMGSGSFGRVIKVQDKSNRTSLFAVKIINIKTLSDQKMLNTNHKEVELLSNCDEKFVAKYFVSWTEKDQFFIQMELCSDNLKNIIKNKKDCFERKDMEVMSLVEYYISSQLMKELLECVQYLHQLNPPIIHRDLKPANILVNYESKNGRFIKICDFGLATSDGHYKTISHTANVGTIKYVSPEVLNGTNGRAMYTTKSDIFSTGYIMCDLFDFDMNSSLMSVQNNEELPEKWRELEKQVILMLSTMYRERPTCAQVLSAFELWGIQEITSGDQKTEKYKQNLIQLEKFNNHFFYNYFVEKVFILNKI